MQRDNRPLRTLTKVVAASGTPEPVIPLNTSGPFKKAWVMGMKDPRTNNTGTVYLCASPDNDQPGIPIATGATVVIEAPIDSYFNWSQFYLDVATNADGIVALYDTFS